MSGKLLGIAKILVDGAALKTMPGAKLNLGGVERIPMEGDGEVLGYAEQTKASLLECEIALGVGDTLESLRQTKDATVRFEADTGQVYQIAHAFLTEPLEVTAGEGGQIPVKLAGAPAEEIT